MLALLVSVATAAAGDPALVFLAPVMADAGLTVIQPDGASLERSDFDADGQVDTVVFLTSTAAADRSARHALVWSARARFWLSWEHHDFVRTEGWSFCEPGSGSGRRCVQLEFTSGQPRITRTTRGSLEWGTTCDYRTGRCEACDTCDSPDGRSSWRVPKWSAPVPLPVRWHRVTTQARLLRWLRQPKN